jgi:hypothetical protein
MQFAKGKHWLACVAGVAALFGWLLITCWFSSGEVLQRLDELRLSSMHFAASQLRFGAVAGWLVAFVLSHLFLCRIGKGDFDEWLAVLFFAAAMPAGVIALGVCRSVDAGSTHELIPYMDLTGTAFPGALIGWVSGLVAAFVLALKVEGRSLAPLRAFVYGLIALVYIGAEGMAAGGDFAAYSDPWTGIRAPAVSPWSVPAAHFAFGLLAGWILPFLARWRLNLSEWWFALAGIIGLAMLYGSGWGVSSWPPGSGRWTEPHLMSGFWPPFSNGLMFGLTAAAVLLSRSPRKSPNP